MPPRQPDQGARLSEAAWERLTIQPPSLTFEPAPPKGCAYDVPDIECEGWSTDRLTLRSASVRGDSHRWPSRAKPRQDCVRATVHEPTGTVIFAVADGVSAAARSELGAREACRGAIEMLIEQISQRGAIDYEAVVRHAAERLADLTRWYLGMAHTKSPDTEEISGLFATALVTGFVQPTPDGAAVGLCRVGDSGAWVLNRDAQPHDPQLYTALFSTKTGAGKDFVSNRVVALPRIPQQLEHTQFQLAARDTLLVGTDGFGDPLGDGDGELGALFAHQLQIPPTPLWFAHVLDFSRETFDDDRTLLVVWPRQTTSKH